MPFFSRPVRLRRPGGTISAAVTPTPPPTTPFIVRPVRLRRPGGLVGPPPAPAAPPTVAARLPIGRVVTRAHDDDARPTVGGVTVPAAAQPPLIWPRVVVRGEEFAWWEWPTTTRPAALRRLPRLVPQGRVVIQAHGEAQVPQAGGVAVPMPGGGAWPWFADDELTGYLGLFGLGR